MAVQVPLDRDRIAQFLEQFRERRERADALEHAHATHDRDRISALLDGYDRAVQRHRQLQESAADDFNLLEVLQLTGNEIRHSMALAWLLDHDLRKLGTHAQGNLGFRLFLTELDLPIEYAGYKYWVRREVAGDQSIVDIEVGCRGKFLIHIENKIWSGTDQTDREWPDLQRRAAGLHVSESDVHAFFLTPRGTTPMNSNFRAISWGCIVWVIERFAEQAQPPDVKLFAAHYARALRRFIVIQDTREDNDAKAALERG